MSKRECSFPEGGGRRPNVVLVVCDVIGFAEIGAYADRELPDWNVYGGERAHTPNLDAIARGGALSTRYYATSSILYPQPRSR